MSELFCILSSVWWRLLHYRHCSGYFLASHGVLLVFFLHQFSVGTNQSYQESHCFSFSGHYPRGINTAVYHPGHRWATMSSPWRSVRWMETSWHSFREKTVSTLLSLALFVPLVYSYLKYLWHGGSCLLSISDRRADWARSIPRGSFSLHLLNLIFLIWKMSMYLTSSTLACWENSQKAASEVPLQRRAPSACLPSCPPPLLLCRLGQLPSWHSWSLHLWPILQRCHFSAYYLPPALKVSWKLGIIYFWWFLSFHFVILRVKFTSIL